jgi:predicted transcriptional regulator
LIKPIADYLHGYSLVAIPIVVNALTLNLKLGPDEATNSTLLIGPKGYGRTTLTHHILRASNPEYFPILPDKHFESEIVDQPDDIFNKKVWVQDDLITIFRGTSTKQREQLMGFHIAFLTKGEYGRQRKKVKGRIVCLYTIASEGMKKYQKAMFWSTFSDRFMPVKYDIDKTMKREMRAFRRMNKGKQIPDVKLPFMKEEVDVEIPSVFNSDIDEFVEELEEKNIMSGIRAQTYIDNFLKSNALINGRNVVNEDDLRLFKMVYPLHFGVNLGSIETRVRLCILEKAINGEATSGQEVKDTVMSMLGCSESAIQKSLSDLRDNNVVNFQKISLSRGYDFIYWL